MCDKRGEAKKGVNDNLSTMKIEILIFFPL